MVSTERLAPRELRLHFASAARSEARRGARITRHRRRARSDRMNTDVARCAASCLSDVAQTAGQRRASQIPKRRIVSSSRSSRYVSDGTGERSSMGRCRFKGPPNHRHGLCRTTSRPSYPSKQAVTALTCPPVWRGVPWMMGT